jgi:hypothetical protein
MHRHSLAFLALLVGTPILVAQVNPGDIALTGFSSTTFGVFTGTTPVTGYPTTGFQGSGTSQAILWDPQNPASFLVGGFGFLGRATVLGPGNVVYTLLTTDIGVVSQMSFDQNHHVVFVDSTSAQVRRLDPVNGVVTEMSSGAQPWGSELSSGVVDPLTGDVVVGGNGAIYRLPNGQTTGVPVVASLGGYVTGIAFDPVTGDVIATVLTVNRVIRVDGSSAITNVCPAGSVPGPNALDVDHNGDFIAGGGTGQVYRIPRAGGAPVFLVNNTAPLGNVNGIAVAWGGGYGRPFGVGCAATFGTATLRATGPFRANQTVTTISTGHGPGAAGLLVLGLSASDWGGVPLPASLDATFGTVGCNLFVSADALLNGVANGSSPASLSFPLALGPAFAGRTFYAQHVALDAAPGGLSFSNGLAFGIR